MDQFSPSFVSDAELIKFQRPIMLKDFLLTSSSSNGFVSFPGRSDTTVGKILEIDLNAGDSAQQRSRWTTATASTTSSLLHKTSLTVINTVKHLQFYCVNSPPKQGLLPRSFSKRLRKSFLMKKTNKDGTEQKIRARFTYFIRWKSFGVREKKEKKTALDITRGKISASSSTSSNSSWLESDCASESVHSSGGSSEYSGETEGHCGKKDLQRRSGCGVVIGEDSMETAARFGEPERGRKEEGITLLYEEKEQLGPVSVLDVPHDEDPPPSSAFKQERPPPKTEGKKKHIHQKNRRFQLLSQPGPINLDKHIFWEEAEDVDEEEEEDMEAKSKAKDFLKLLKPRYDETQKGKTAIEKMMLDFFAERLVKPKTEPLSRSEKEELKSQLLREAGSWMNGSGGKGLGVENNEVEYIEEMEKSRSWRKYEMEEEEVAVEIETWLFGLLMDDLVLNLLLL